MTETRLFRGVFAAGFTILSVVVMTIAGQPALGFGLPATIFGSIALVGAATAIAQKVRRRLGRPELTRADRDVVRLVASPVCALFIAGVHIVWQPPAFDAASVVAAVFVAMLTGAVGTLGLLVAHLRLNEVSR